MSAFVKNGGTILPARDRGNEVPTIPVGVWSICYDQMMGFHLVAHPDFSAPTKVYGSTDDRADRVVTTFLDRENVNTGVLLSGNKGSGKTLLSKRVCAKILAAGMPVLIMDEPFGGSEFNQFMNSITQRCVVFIDEFEKKYKRTEDQNLLLSLLDGTGVNNKLFLLTSNSADVSEFLISRPSRVFYHWTFGKMERDVVEGYCTEKLKDQKHLENMLTLWSISTDMSFDVMQAIVEELNRYPELSFLDAICNMNISLGNALSRNFKVVSVTHGDTEIEVKSNNFKINLLDFQAGDAFVRQNIEVDDWNFHIAVKASLHTKEFYSYNTGLYSMLEKGEITNEEIIENNSYSDDLYFTLKFDETTDSMTTDDIEIVRMVSGTPMVFKFKAISDTAINEYFARLFK